MIHIFIGTKAQYIKTAPVLRLLDQTGIIYNLIDSGQHAQITRNLRKELNIREPDTFLGGQGDISKIPEALFWFFKCSLLSLFVPKKVLESVFKGKKGICVIHGDTLSTLLSLFMAKRAGLKVAHIEAGLRSFNWLNPFPEELIRVITMRFSDILFAPSDWAYSNLLKMRLKGKLINLKNNINYESCKSSLERHTKRFNLSNYCLVTIHRTENIMSRKRLEAIVNLLLDIAKTQKKVIFIMHEPTRMSLDKFKFLKRLSGNSNIIISSLLAHNEFIATLKDADFLITDGGSIQEESFYLGIPCMLMRKATERQEGIGENVFLSEFRDEKIAYFLKEFKRFKVNKELSPAVLASKIIADEIKALEGL